MNNQLSIKVRPLSAAEYGKFLARGKMSAGEKAARLYLGKKQAEKMARIDWLFMAAWFSLLVAAIVAPVVLILGV